MDAGYSPRMNSEPRRRDRDDDSSAMCHSIAIVALLSVLRGERKLACRLQFAQRARVQDQNLHAIGLSPTLPSE
jgi:hypothetical protein